MYFQAIYNKKWSWNCLENQERKKNSTNVIQIYLILFLSFLFFQAIQWLFLIGRISRPISTCNVISIDHMLRYEITNTYNYIETRVCYGSQDPSISTTNHALIYETPLFGFLVLDFQKSVLVAPRVSLFQGRCLRISRTINVHFNKLHCKSQSISKHLIWSASQRYCASSSGIFYYENQSTGALIVSTA